MHLLQLNGRFSTDPLRPLFSPKALVNDAIERARGRV
jgi:hypothetical protein